MRNGRRIKMENLKFPMFMLFKEKTPISILTVKGYIKDGMTYVDKKGYINPDDDIVYRFTEHPERHDSTGFPRFYYKDGKLEFSELPENHEMFHTNKLVRYNADEINNSTKSTDILYDEKVMNTMSMSSTVFKPEIKENDDFLTKMIKQLILDKNIDLKTLVPLVEKPHDISNMKSALSGSTKMSVPNFIKWCELLNVEWELYITNGEKPSRVSAPLKKSIVYQSENNTVDHCD